MNVVMVMQSVAQSDPLDLTTTFILADGSWQSFHDYTDASQRYFGGIGAERRPLPSIALSELIPAEFLSADGIYMLEQAQKKDRAA